MELVAAVGIVVTQRVLRAAARGSGSGCRSASVEVGQRLRRASAGARSSSRSRQFQSWSPVVVPEVRAGRRRPAGSWPEERVELTGQPALGDREREPAGLRPVRVVARSAGGTRRRGVVPSHGPFLPAPGGAVEELRASVAKWSGSTRMNSASAVASTRPASRASPSTTILRPSRLRIRARNSWGSRSAPGRGSSPRAAR